MAAAKGMNVKEMVWPLATAFLALLCLVLTFALFGAGGDLAERAWQEGRRIGITLSDGEVLGNPAPAPKEKKKKEPDASEAEPASGSETKAAAEADPQEAPKMKEAMPGNFVGEQMESQRPEAEAKAESVAVAEKKTEYDYPLAVKPDPQHAGLAVGAPAPLVKVRELLEEARPGKALPFAPADGLSEEDETGMHLPVISPDGRTPWQAYAKPFEASATEPLVAVVVTDLGISHQQTQQALKLDPHFTYSFSPYSAESEMWARTARNIGHEVLLDFPMQMSDYPASDPGPKGWLLAIEDEKNLERMRWVLGRIQGYVGLLAPMTASLPEGAVLPALSEIAKRGLIFVRSPDGVRPIGSSEGAAKKLGLKEVIAPILIDETISEPSIRGKLDELVALAKKNGQALGVARSTPITLEMLQAWRKTLESQGVRLAPVSALAARVK